MRALYYTRYANSIWSLPSTQKKHHRAYSHDIQSFGDKMYHQLINRKENTPSVSCNFVTQILDRWSREHPKNQAIRWVDLEKNHVVKKITYSALVEQSYHIGHFFEAQGIKKGDAVALMLGQRVDWWYSVASLMRSGIAIVPCPRLLTSKDLSYRINDLGIRGIVTTPNYQSRVDAIRHECPSLISTVTTGAASVDWPTLDKISYSYSTPPTVQKTTTDDPCVYLYTSGTTGQPKAVQHHHDYPFFHLSITHK